MTRSTPYDSMSPRRRLASAALVTVLLYVVAGTAALGLVLQARGGARVPLETVTGRAAAAVGDSGAFAMSAPPPGVRPVMLLADAESAAVAMAYFWAPSYQDTSVPYYQTRPTERRRLCGRSYYVRPVVALPDSHVVHSAVTTDFVITWGPAWVIPACDAAGFPRRTTLVADAPTGLRVLLGDHPDDVPELVFPMSEPPRIGSVDPWLFRGWERGIALSPETAVTVAATELAAAGARIADVPEAFVVVIPPDVAPKQAAIPQTPVQPQACPRWRLMLDRAVVLRGLTSNQVVRTRTVYVARGDSGCDGPPTLQIPRPAQPATLPFMYGVRPGWPRDTVLMPVNGRPVRPPDLQERWAALRVTEPVWFEEARLQADVPGRDRDPVGATGDKNR